MQDFAEKMKEFQRIKDEQGDAAFQAAVQAFASEVMAGGGPEALSTLAQQFFANFQKEQAAYQEGASKRAVHQNTQAEKMRAAKPNPLESDQAFLRAIQQTMPAIRSQAQFNAFMAAFDALRGTLNAVFAKDEQAFKVYRAALDKALLAAEQVTEVTERLQEVPEAAESKLADEFKNPPRQFGEYDLQRTLLSELAAIRSSDGLSRWWTTNRQRIDEVRSPTLRNPLIDAVRAKKEELA